jgi:hypothetical protein
MKKLRALLFVFALFGLFMPLAQAVDVTAANGIKVSQISYPGAPFTKIGWLQVDLNQLRSSTGIASGFINVATSTGWVVRDLPVPAEEDYPYSMINTKFDLGADSGTKKDQISASISYTATLQTSYSLSTTSDYAVDEYAMSVSAVGTGAVGGPPVLPPSFTDILLSDATKNEKVIQWDHPNQEAATNQCAPMSIANSLQYLHDTQGLSLPFEHKPGVKGDDSLVGKIDSAADRTAPDRTHGEGIWLLQAKLKFLAANNLGNKVETKMWGEYVVDSGASNTTVSVDGNSATATGMGTTLNIPQVMQQMKEGADCEMVVTYDSGGAHAVDLVGAGFHNGTPWLLWTSDVKQADEVNGDQRGGGPQGMEFGYLGTQNAGIYKSGSTSFRQIVCEKPVPPPVTETITHVTDPADHSPFVNAPPSMVRIAEYNGTMNMSSGSTSASWLPMTGTIMPNGSFSLASTATVAGFSNVTSTFIGNVQGDNYMGKITVGAGGQLPTHQAISWDVTIPRTPQSTMLAMRVNGFRHQHTASSADLLRPSVSVKAGSAAGTPGDLWIAASTSGFFFHFNLDTMSWQQGLAPSLTGPLSDVPFFTLPYLNLPPGVYNLYLGFDSVPDGQLSMESLSYEQTTLTVD